MEHIDTVVIGGGQAGLAMSRELAVRGRDPVVLERARVAERWRTERWDSLMFQFPNWSIALPGSAYSGSAPDAFASRDEVLRFIEAYAALHGAPVRTGVNVTELRALPGGTGFAIACTTGAIAARNVVVATGPYQKPRRPRFADLLPSRIVQIDAAAYRSPAQLPPGVVLVVGAGASGCQIADELVEAGRDVVLSIGRHRRVPRRYRGKDVFWWRREMGELDREVEATPPGHRLPPPLVTGVRGGYDVDLRRTAAAGARLAGHVAEIAQGGIVFSDDVEASLREGDRTFAAFVAAVDTFVRSAHLVAPEAPECPAAPAPVAGLARLDATDISAVVWCTGYQFDFGWVKVPVVDAGGAPVHQRGITACPGLYFLGLPWLSKAKSSFLYGVGEDAQRIAAHIAATPR